MFEYIDIVIVRDSDFDVSIISKKIFFKRMNDCFMNKTNFI